MSSDSADSSIRFYLQDDNLVRKYHHVKTVEVPLADVDADVDDDEIVSVEIPKDLRDDPTELCTLLENSFRVKKEAWLAVAVSYALQNKFDQAVETVKSAFQSQQLSEGGNFQKFPFHIFLAWLYLRKSRVAQSAQEKDSCFRFASEEVDTALSINPVSNEALLARAVLFAQTNPNALDDLLELYEKILKNDSNNVYALFGKAKIIFKKRNYNLALKIFQQVLILNPLLKPDSRIGIGLCFWFLGDSRSAVSAWERSAELFPNDFANNLLLSIVKFNNAFNESLTDTEFLEKYTGAIQVVAKFYNGSGLSGTETSSQDYKKNPFLLNILSSYLFSKNDLGLLVQLLDTFINKNDLLESFSRNVISDLYFWLARAYFTSAITENTEEFNLNENVKSLSKDSLLNRAQQLISKSLRFDKNNLYSKFLSGQIQYYKKNINESILIFENLIKNYENEINNNLNKSFKKDNKDKLVEINYMLGLLYHEKVFSDFEEITKAGAVSTTSKPLASDAKAPSLNTKENHENINKSIQYLTNYLKLCLQLKESVIINAYLTLAKNYEFLNQVDKVLNNLEKAVELYKLHNGVLNEDGNLVEQPQKQIPAEILNNIGVFQFLKNNFAASKTFFSLAWDANQDQIDELTENKKTTIQYNIARVKEIDLLAKGFSEESIKETTDKDDEELKDESLIMTTTREIQKLYDQVLERAPNYMYAKLRSYYILALNPLYTASDENLDKLNDDIQALLLSYESNLEVRAFYGWFLKKFNKRLTSYRDIMKTENPEAKLYKDTLTKYDSHDSYSLISLGNIYLLLAREFKNNAKFKGGKMTLADVNKQNNYYMRAAQLYQKVLSVNLNNLFAAQGLAIVFSELKKSDIALEIFRKIRDSLNDVSIFINLGHVFIEVKEYSKAIECYEIVVNRFGGHGESSVLHGSENDQDMDIFNEEALSVYKNNMHILNTDSRYFTLLGRAWYCRGIGEKSLEALQNSLKYSKKAFIIAYVQQLTNANANTNLLPSLRFNIAFVYFQVAEFIRKLPKNKRTSEEIEKTITGLEFAIKTLEDLSELKNPPYLPADLKQRAVMGSNTIKNSLLKELEVQKNYEKEFADKILEGKKIREAEREKMLEEQRKNKENEDRIKEKLKQEREELQKKALEWATELAERNLLAEAQEKKKKSKKVDEDGFILGDDDGEESGYEDGGAGAGSDNGGNGKARSGRRTKKKTRSAKGSGGGRRKRGKDDKLEDDGDVNDGEEREGKKRKLVKKYKSQDVIEDSDEEANYDEEPEAGDISTTTNGAAEEEEQEEEQDGGDKNDERGNGEGDETDKKEAAAGHESDGDEGDDLF